MLRAISCSQSISASKSRRHHLHTLLRMVQWHQGTALRPPPPAVLQWVFLCPAEPLPILFSLFIYVSCTAILNYRLKQTKWKLIIYFQLCWRFITTQLAWICHVWDRGFTRSGPICITQHGETISSQRIVKFKHQPNLFRVIYEILNITLMELLTAITTAT